MTHLPAFYGGSLLFLCSGSANDLLDVYWDALDAENQVALAVKWIPMHGGPSEIIIRNRFGDE
jgi:IMP cyclohydrolase